MFLEASLRTSILIPTDRTTVSGAYQVNPAVGVEIRSDATVHRQFLFNFLVQPLAGRRIFGSVKDMHASTGAAVVVGDDSSRPSPLRSTTAISCPLATLSNMTRRSHRPLYRYRRRLRFRATARPRRRTSWRFAFRRRRRWRQAEAPSRRMTGGQQLLFELHAVARAGCAI